MRFVAKIGVWILITSYLLSCGGPAPPVPTPLGPTTSAPPPLTKTLSISPTIQQTIQWCWAASAQMVLGYYNYPSINAASPQCGIVAVWFGGQCAYDCSSCVFPISTMSDENIVIDNYGPFISGYLPGYYPPLISAVLFRPLSMDEVIWEISENRPILIGIAPNGGLALPNLSAHASVLIGYDVSSGRTDVIVNDPFPYFLYNNAPNPYLLAGATSPKLGQYRIPYLALVQNLAWANTIYGIRRAI